MLNHHATLDNSSRVLCSVSLPSDSNNATSWESKFEKVAGFQLKDKYLYSIKES